MPLIKDGRTVEDRFVRLDEEGPLPDVVPVLVPAERFLADQAEYLAAKVPLGVLWPNNKRVSELEPYLGRLALIALHFPAFKDGRAYSQARILRERYKYKGELRATGDILQDQFLFLLRAGFNSFEVKKDADAAAFAEAAHRYSIFYQPTGDGRTTALRERLRRFHANETSASVPDKEHAS
jgi:uncharacterized protein (DUF934 family)